MKARALPSLILPALVAVIVLVVALSLGKSRPAPAATAPRSASVTGGTARVKVYMFAFTPDSLTVKVGTRITFTNRDQTAHTATALNGAFDTGTINPGASRTIVVRRAGTYAYHCLFHAFMTGTIRVIG